MKINMGALAAAGLTLAIAAATPATTVAQTVAITGGKVYPVSGPPIENATVVIVDGKITAVGANVTVPAGATTVDAKGKWVTPGLIIGASALGLVETGADPGTTVAVLCALGFGALVGAVNGFLVTRCRIVPFIATLGTMSLVRGILLTYTRQESVVGQDPGFGFWGGGSGKGGTGGTADGSPGTPG